MNGKGRDKEKRFLSSEVMQCNHAGSQNDAPENGSRVIA